MPRIALCLLALLCLPACGGHVAAPSLMPRAVERQSIDLPLADAQEAERAADPALQAAVTTRLNAAAAADRDFAERRGEADTAVKRAAGAAAGSDAWVAAQQAISALEAARAPVRDAAAAVDALRDDPANTASGSRAAIDAAAVQIAAIERAQEATVTALAARLR